MVLVFLRGIAKIYPNLSNGAKKYQQAFAVPLPGMDSISILGNCAKKCQQCDQCSILANKENQIPF